MLSGMNENGEILFGMNCISTSLSELAEPLANLADIREERGIDMKLLTVDNPSKDGQALLSLLRSTSLPAFKFGGLVIEVSNEATCTAAFLRLHAELDKCDHKMAGVDVEYVTYYGKDVAQGAECNHKYADIAQICVGDVCVLILFNAPLLTVEARAALYKPFQNFLMNSDIEKVKWDGLCVSAVFR
jgi:hypothetical protein